MIQHNYDREDWQDPANPVTSSAPFPPWSAIQRIVVHYPGADYRDMDFDNDGDVDKDDTAAVLRSTQAYYTGSRRYSIGYNSAVGQEGATWQLRGDTYRCAANVEVNLSSYAILILVDGDAPANAAQVKAVRDLVAQIRQHAGRKIPVVGHGSVGSTACPGAGIKAQITAGAFEPRPTATLPLPVLKFGMRGPEVKRLRDLLVFLGHMKRTGDGFGVLTVAGVRRFQRSVKVPVTGRWDMTTFKAAQAALT